MSGADGAGNGTAGPGPGLSQFFEVMVPFLKGERSLDQVVQVLGEPSRRDRLDLVRRMILRARVQLLERVFAATRHAADSMEPGFFERIVSAHLDHEAWGEADFPAVANGFTETVERRLDVPSPEWLVALADFEETVHRLRHFPLADHGGVVHPSVVVRHYSFDVPRFVREVGEGRPPKLDGPTPFADDPGCIVLIYRDEQAGRPRYMTATAGHVAVLAAAGGQADRRQLEQALGEEALSRAEAELRARGLLRGSGSA